MLAALILLLVGGYEAKEWFTVLILGGALWLYFTLSLQSLIVRPLQTASNMLSGLREGDFSIHPSYIDSSDALGQLLLEINLLTETLREHRMGALEAHSLLDKVVDEIDAAVFTFDPQNRLTLCNRAGAKLLGRAEPTKLRQKSAAELGLASALATVSESVIPHPLDRPGRFTVRRGSYRVGGKPHAILILIDVSQNLREEELLAWKRLIRVLGHELNNSMAPIKSIANSLAKLVRHDRPLDAEDRQDLIENLEVIETRADGLSRFVRDYARLAKLPPPVFRRFDLLEHARRITGLSENVAVAISPESKAVEIEADPDQIEQLLINLLKNAAEATMESLPPGMPPSSRPVVRLHWETDDERLCLFVEDEGPGVANPANLFVPFFSTKHGGSGIGLTLCRQIAEGHSGAIRLTNRTDVPHGCRVEVEIPLRQF